MKPPMKRWKAGDAPIAWAVAVLLLGAPLAGCATPEILIVGDSWAMSLTAENRNDFPTEDVFDQFLADRGLEALETRGAVTAWGGSKASDWAKPEHLAELREELQRHPSLRFVHLIIGGNDFLATAMDPGLVNTTAEERAGRWDPVEKNIQTIVDTCLAVRSDVRVVIAGYDFLDTETASAVFGMNFHGAAQAQLNRWLAELGRRKLAIANRTPRCHYVQNWGVLQHCFGEPPQSVPLPGQAPDYKPYPGGDPERGMPEAITADGIHPNAKGHRKLLENAIEHYYETWITGERK